MALKKFIGARYAPEFAGAWSNTKQYAAQIGRAHV